MTNKHSKEIISVLENKIPNLHDFYNDEQLENMLKDSIFEKIENISDFPILGYFMSLIWDDNIRRCSYCGKLMDAGYLLSDEYACSEQCRNEIYKIWYPEFKTDKEAEEQYNDDYENGDGDCFYTEWF